MTTRAQRVRQKATQTVWEWLRTKNIGELVDKVKFYADAVKHGADPIEALSGHLCGPKCWHWPFMSKDEQAKLRKAPWNQEVE